MYYAWRMNANVYDAACNPHALLKGLPSKRFVTYTHTHPGV